MTESLQFKDMAQGKKHVYSGSMAQNAWKVSTYSSVVPTVFDVFLLTNKGCLCYILYTLLMCQKQYLYVLSLDF